MSNVTEAMVAAALRHLDQRAESGQCGEMVREMLEAAETAAWQSMGSAPRGTYRKVPMAKGERDVFVPDRIWTFRHRDGHLTQSAYDPERDAWVAWSKDAPPDVWLPFLPATPSVPATPA